MTPPSPFSAKLGANPPPPPKDLLLALITLPTCCSHGWPHYTFLEVTGVQKLKKKNLMV